MVVLDIFPIKGAHWVNIIILELVLVGSQRMGDFLTSSINKSAIRVDVLIAWMKIVILAIILIVMVLERDHRILIQEHDVLNLSEGMGQLRFCALLQGLQLRIEVDGLVRVVLDVVKVHSRLKPRDVHGCIGACGGFLSCRHSKVFVVILDHH